MENNYYMYLRKSRADKEAELHGEGETLKRHENILFSLAKSHGYTISKIYREIVSAESIETRPQMRNMLRDMEQGGCAGVLVMEIERLARGDSIDQGIIARAFRYAGAKIITPSKIYDPLDEFDEEYFEFGLFMSRREYKTILRRMNRGRIAAVKEGRYAASSAPYGYERIKIPNDKGYTLQPVPKEAAVVRLIFDLYTKGLNGEAYGFRKIAEYLNTLNLPKRIANHWSPSTVRDILKNETYTGKIIWQKRREIKQLQNGIIKNTRPLSESYLCTPGLHTAIISEEQFKAAASLTALRNNPAAPGPHTLKNPLSGLVYCSLCGSLMTRMAANSKTHYDVLKCPNPSCPNISAPLQLIEEALLHACQDWFAGYRIKTAYTIAYSAQPGPAPLQAIKEELKSCKSQIANACCFLETGLYTPSMFEQRMKTLQTKLTALEDIESKLHQMPELKNSGMAQEKTADSHIFDYYAKATTASLKNRLLKSILHKITYQKTERSRRGSQRDGDFLLNIHARYPYQPGK